MNAFRDPCARLSRSLLLVALLVAQSFVLVHEIDHFSKHETNLCAVCQVGHGLASPAVNTSAPSFISLSASVAFIPAAIPVAVAPSHPSQARAPPHSLLADSPA